MRTETWIAFLAAVSGLIVAVVASWLGGFLGIGLAGLFIGLGAVNFDLRKDDFGGGFPSESLYARQVEVRARMTAEERLAHRARMRALWRPLVIARTMSAGLIAVGFGGYLLL